MSLPLPLTMTWYNCAERRWLGEGRRRSTGRKNPGSFEAPM